LGRKKRIQWFIIALVNVPVKAFCWQRLTADERKNDVTDDGTTPVRKTGSETESEMESVFRNFSMKIA